MQTFLPFPNFVQSAQCLDSRRLGKQRVEVMQILRALQPDTSSGWRNHPATLMWKGYESALESYGIVICNEWISRGFEDNCISVIKEIADTFPNLERHKLKFPKWMGDDRFHRSHQSNLLRKYKTHYEKYFYDVPNDLDYFWPTKEGY